MSSSSVVKLTSKDLAVLTAESEGFLSALAGRAFNGRLPGPSTFPKAILRAKSVPAVQEAIRYCRNHRLQVSVRSGGHSWDCTWLHGENSVLLDVGDLNDIQLQLPSASALVGPGAKGNDVLEACLAEDLFFPSGHCRGVPVGGFLLGGGYGIGYSKYGLSCHFIQEINVVLADGTLLLAKPGSNDPKERAIFQLTMGSYCAFPGVITQYKLGPLPKKPTVFRGAVMYPLENWQKALDLGRSICPTNAMETTIVLTYTPPPIAEATGVTMMALVVLDIYAHNGVELFEAHTRNIQAEDLLAPLETPKSCDPKDIPSSMFYPDHARYQSQVFVGKKGIWDASIHDTLQPLVDMWMSDDKPPPPSHSLLVCVPSTLPGDHHTLAYGFEPALNVMSYAIYTDQNLDQAIQRQLAKAHQAVADHGDFYTSLVEGNVRRYGGPSGFTPQAWAETQEAVRLLDPEGVFAGFPKCQPE